MARLLVYELVAVYGPASGLSIKCWFDVLICKFLANGIGAGFYPVSATLVDTRGVRSL